MHGEHAACFSCPVLWVAWKMLELSDCPQKQSTVTNTCVPVSNRKDRGRGVQAGVSAGATVACHRDQTPSSCSVGALPRGAGDRSRAQEHVRQPAPARGSLDPLPAHTDALLALLRHARPLATAPVTLQLQRPGSPRPGLLRACRATRAPRTGGVRGAGGLRAVQGADVGQRSSRGLGGSLHVRSIS